jgi:purine-cytosine permease-like protein
MDSEQFLPPTPRALSDAELQEVLDRAKADGGGILAAMQILEAQAQLRETDKSELRAWQARQSTRVEETHSAEQEATASDEALTSNVLEVSAQPNEDDIVPVQTHPIPDAPILADPVQAAPIDEPVVEVIVETKRDAKDPSSSQFWVWLTISGSLLPFGVALWLRSLGLTFSQSLVAGMLGMFASAGVVAVGAIAGKRSSLPTLVLSRAAFGVFGNLAPAVFLVFSRLFWALVLVILGYILIAQSLTASDAVISEALPVSVLSIAVLIVVVGAAVVLSAIGGTKLIWAQRISGVLGVITALAIAFSRIGAYGFAVNANQDGSWLRALGAGVVIFAVFGLAWSSASADYASGLPVNVRGWKVVVWALLAMGVVPATLTWLGLAVFGDLTNSDFAYSFNGIVAGSSWSVLNVLVQISIAFTLLTTIAMSLRSSSMSFESIQLKFKVSIATPVIATLTTLLAVVGLARLGSAGFWFNLNGYALVLAVPVAAWSGVFVSDVLIRRIAYHEVSLSRGYGFYKSVNPVNLMGWALAVFLGWGLLRSQLVEFQWLGFLSNFASNSQFWAQSNFGVVIAFAIGLLLPVVGGIPRIKKQEAEVLLIEARRNDLKNVLGLVD